LPFVRVFSQVISNVNLPSASLLKTSVLGAWYAEGIPRPTQCFPDGHFTTTTLSFSATTVPYPPLSMPSHFTLFWEKRVILKRLGGIWMPSLMREIVRFWVSSLCS
jgi:hypothetical protein